MVNCSRSEKLISELSDAQEKIERYSRKNAGASDNPELAEIERENAALREEMAVLAARMVAATAEKKDRNLRSIQFLKRQKNLTQEKTRNPAPKSGAPHSRPAIEHFQFKSNRWKCSISLFYVHLYPIVAKSEISPVD